MDGSKTGPKALSKKKRSLADCLVNRNTNLNASASSPVTNSTSSTDNSTTANNSTSSTVLVNAEPSHKKRRTKDEHFKSDYETELKQSLTKLAETNFIATCLTKKQCCAILWEVCNKFHRGTKKKIDAKTALMLLY